MSIPRITPFILIASLGFPSTAMAQVNLHYNARPPYMVFKDGALTGLTGGPASAAFKAAGIPHVIMATPSARQTYLIKENVGQDCGINWFKNPEREGFAKFTKAIYQDKPQIGLTATSNGKLKNGDPVEGVLANKGIKLLVKQGYSYGKTLDALIEKLQPTQTAVTQENIQMAQMIQANRADYMFMAPEEADGVIAETGMKAEDFRKITFGDAPQGEFRYIMCSKNVPDDVITKLNAVIK